MIRSKDILRRSTTAFVFIGLLAALPRLAPAAGLADVLPLPPAGWKDDSWTDPGGWETVDVTRAGLLPGSESVDATKVVRRIIEGGSGHRVLYFPEGDYWFKSDLVITESGIRLVGDGPARTRFFQDNARFTFRGSQPISTTLELVEPPARGATSLISPDADRVEPGSFILPLAQFPFGGNAGGYLALTEKQGVGQIVVVTRVDGQTIHFDDPLGLDYSGFPELRLDALTVSKDVGIENVWIEKLTNHDKSTTQFIGIENGIVRNVRSYFTSKEHVWVARSHRIFIEGSDFSHSHDYGEGGHGYGVQLVDNSTRCYIVNNKFGTLRHAVVIQEGANHNVIAYNHNDGSNLLLHGNYAHNNLFEGNVADSGLHFDRVHGTNGPFNTIFRNNAAMGQRGIIPRLASGLPAIVVGNVALKLVVAEDDFVGANRVAEKIEWGAIPPGTVLPASLYREDRPDFLAKTPWPLFGPGVDEDWGAGKSIPAVDRSMTFTGKPPSAAEDP